MTAQLHALPVGNLTDVAKQLRHIADCVESGEWGDVMEGSLVLSGDNGPEVFGLGRADSTATHYILCRGAAKMLRIDLL